MRVVCSCACVRSCAVVCTQWSPFECGFLSKGLWGAVKRPPRCPPPAPHCNPGRPATPFPLPGPTRRPVQLSGPPHPLLEHPGPCVSAPVALPLGVLPICTDGCKTRLMHQFVPSGGCSRRFKGSGLPFDGSAVPEPTCWGCDTGLFSWKVTHTSPIPLPVIAWLPDYPPPPPRMG